MALRNTRTLGQRWWIGASLSLVGALAAGQSKSAKATATLELTVASYIAIGSGSGTVVFSTKSGKDSAVRAGAEKFVVQSNSQNGYSLGAVVVTGNGANLPVVSATARVSSGQGTNPTISDTLTITFKESTTWSIPTTATPIVYSAQVTLTNNS